MTHHPCYNNDPIKVIFFSFYVTYLYKTGTKMEVLKYSFKMAATDSSRCPMYPVMLQSSWIIYVIISNTWMFPASAILNGKSAGLIGAICAPAGPACFFRVLNSKLADGYNRWQTKQLYCRLDLTFYCFLVSRYTTCVQHSSVKVAKCKFALLHWFEIHM